MTSGVNKAEPWCRVFAYWSAAPAFGAVVVTAYPLHLMGTAWVVAGLAGYGIATVPPLFVATAIAR